MNKGGGSSKAEQRHRKPSGRGSIPRRRATPEEFKITFVCEKPNLDRRAAAIQLLLDAAGEAEREQWRHKTAEALKSTKPSTTS